MYIIAMHTIAIALYIKCTYLIAVYIALRPNTPGELKACTRTAQRSLCPPETISAQSSMVKDRYVRQKLYQLKVQRTNVAMSTRNYISATFKGQTSLCAPETISPQSSKDKRRHVRQKLYQLKVQRTNVAMSFRNYISSKFKGQTSLFPPGTISAQSSKDKCRCAV